jgi:PEP-CTERM motif-containing protein
LEIQFMRKQSVVLSMALATLGVASPLAAQSPIGSPCSPAVNAQIYYGGTGIPTDLSYCGADAGNGNVIALMATPRYASAAPTTTGNGVFHALTGESIGAPSNTGFSSWNFSYFAGNLANSPNVNTYRVLVDRDPSAGVNFVQWAQFTGNGYDSSNQGFLPGFDPFAAGLYTIQLDQYAVTGGLVNSVAINVDVTSTVTPEPSSIALMATGLFAVGGFVRRRNKRNVAA